MGVILCTGCLGKCLVCELGSEMTGMEMLGAGETCWGKWLDTTCELFPGTNLAAGLLTTVLKTGEADKVL